ncbi:MAG: tannase [Atopobiaceae bacterium]|nr:tannase [Atopobiaceae bacterium]
MAFTRKEFLSFAALSAAGSLAACTPQAKPTNDSSEQPSSNVDLNEFKSLALDMSQWNYDEENDCYYQLGIQYCTKPASKSFNTLSIFVPGKYFSSKKNGSVYTCEISSKAVVGNFTASTAPIAMPINTAALSPQSAPTSYTYEGLATYLEAGCIYVYTGFRGRSAGYDSTTGSDELYAGGSPWPAVDFKAAIRYLRYNKASLPCDVSKIFVFGFAAGGGLSAVLGASGDSPLYAKYLDAVGAATHDEKGNQLSDAIYGSASWCPATSYDLADAAYEWSAGQYADAKDSRADGVWTQALSQGLAGAYAEFVNKMDFLASDDSKVSLDETNSGVYTAGSYAELLISELESSANSFIKETAFPYTSTPQRLEEPSFPGDPNLATARGTDTSAAPSTQQVQSTIYDTAEHYFGSLNSGNVWVVYNLRRQSVDVENLREFSRALRGAELSVGAFDAPDRSTRANQLFGVGEQSTLHFDEQITALIKKNLDSYMKLSNWKSSYANDWSSDLNKVDTLENDIPTRVNMFNPLYFVSGAYDGYQTAQVASYWRINEGVQNTDTSICTSFNLGLSLKHYSGVSRVDYNLVWDKGHVLAERSGNAATNLVSWIVSCASA